MSDLIDRDRAIAETWKETRYTDAVNALTEIRERLENLPSAEKHGRWLRPRPVPQVWSLFVADCSVCGKITYMGDYCMECGAKMEENDD